MEKSTQLMKKSTQLTHYRPSYKPDFNGWGGEDGLGVSS